MNEQVWFGLDGRGVKALGVGGERLPIGAYQADVVSMIPQDKKGDSSKKVVNFTLTFVEPGYEGTERHLYMGPPRAITQGMSQDEIRAAQFVKRQWITFLRSRGYTEQQLQTENIPIGPHLIEKGKRVYVFIDHEESDLIDETTGQPVIDPATRQPRKRISEDRMFCTPEDYQKHRVGLKQAKKEASTLAAQAATAPVTAFAPLAAATTVGNPFAAPAADGFATPPAPPAAPATNPFNGGVPGGGPNPFAPPAGALPPGLGPRV